MKKVDIYKWGRRLSPETEATGTLMLGSPASRTVRNEYLLFKPPILRQFVIAAQAKTVFDPYIFFFFFK